MNLQKPKRHINKPYLEFLRDERCCACGKYSGTLGKRTEPHHMITVKAGGADETACPLCRECHAKVGWGRVKFEKLYDVILWMEVVRFNLKFNDIKMRAA